MSLGLAAKAETKALFKVRLSLPLQLKATRHKYRTEANLGQLAYCSESQKAERRSDFAYDGYQTA
jgi:hypothetical protein